MTVVHAAFSYAVRLGGLCEAGELWWLCQLLSGVMEEQAVVAAAATMLLLP